MSKVSDHKLILITSHTKLNMKNESVLYWGRCMRQFISVIRRDLSVYLEKKSTL